MWLHVYCSLDSFPFSTANTHWIHAVHLAGASAHLQTSRSSRSTEASTIWLGEIDLNTTIYTDSKKYLFQMSQPISLTFKVYFTIWLLPLKQSLTPSPSYYQPPAHCAAQSRHFLSIYLTRLSFGSHAFCRCCLSYYLNLSDFNSLLHYSAKMCPNHIC